MSSGGGVMSENISTIITGMNLHVGGGGGDIKPFSTVDEDYAEIRPFFTNDEWSQMSTVLKQRCRQLKQNYELLKMFCVEPEIPDFMAKKAIYGCNNDEVELLPDPVVAAEPRMVTRSALKQGKPFQEPSESRGRQPKRRRQTKETSTKRKRVVVESSDDETDIAVESCSLEFECFKTLDELVDHVSHSIGDDISNSFPSHPLGGATSDSSKQKRKQLHERYLKLKAGVLTRCCDYETGVVNNSGNFSGENTDLGNSPDDGGAFNCQFCAAIFKHYLQLQRHEAVVHRFVDRGTQKLKRKGAAESPGGRRRKKGRTIPSSTKNLRNYQCSICGAAFKRNAHLKRHQTNVHRTSSAQQPTNVSPSNKNRKKPAFYSCDSCNTNFVTEAQLITHQRRRSRCIAGNDFLAKFDDENNFNSQRWRRKTHFRGRFWPLGRRFVCRYCCKLFRNASIQLIHELIHQNRRPYRCDTCGVVFKLQVCLDEHYRRQHLAEQYKCPYCSLALSKLADCRRHVLSCSLRDKCATKNCCETCNKSFKDYYALRRHRECHNDLRPYVCDKCGKRFKSTKNLRGHIAQVHTAQYPFECPVCKKPYKSQSSMRLHKKTHSGNPPLQCPVCSRRFFVRAILERHMVAHTGEKPFLCKVCGAQFARVSHMKRHEYEVHGCDGEWMNGKIPKFECGKCGIVFKRKGHLARHEKAFHGNINVLQPPPSSDGHSWVENDHRCSVSAPVAPKSFVCQICGSVFARQGRLTRHTANVHGLNKRAQLTGNETQMQFDCKQCGRLFKCKEYLTRHEVYVHSGPGTTAADGGAGGGGPAVIAEPQFYICQACGKSFKSSAYLRKHEKAVHGIAGKPQPFACETCGACFKRRDYMKRHEVHAHGASATISGSQHQPSSIQQQSLEPLQQQLHHAKQQSLYTDQHIQEFYFLSPRSAMTMPSTSTCLKVDEVNPSNVSNPVVLVPASSSTVLDFNKSIRPQQNPLTSNSSGKEFSSGTDIITPVACQFCDKVFSGEKYLQMHEASFHGTSAAGEFSSFRCQLCNKGFRRSRHLNRHFKTVHDLSPSQQRSNADQQPSTTQVMTLVDGHLEPQMVTVPSVQQQHRPRRPAASGPRKPRAPKLNPVTVVPAQIQVQQAATPSQQQQQIIPQNIVATIVQDGTTLQIIAPAQVQIAQPSQQIYIERHNIVGGALCFEQLPYSATAATANQISRVASFQLSGQAQSQQPAVTTVQNNNSVQNDLSGILAEFFSNPQLPPSNYYTLL